MKDKPYQEVLGSIMYAQMGTQPDLSHAIASLSRFSTDPGVEHWKALTHVLRYLKATSHFRLRYGGAGVDSFTPVIYVDSEFAGDAEK